MNNSKLGSLLGTLGVIGGVVYGMKKGGGFGKTALFAALFGIGGVVVGNSISKFYEY